jgi:hypothetical protein
MLKIFVHYYKENTFGNSSTLTIFIRNNEVLVSELKNNIVDELGIDPSLQKLTTRILNRTLVLMTNDFPLSFFHINNSIKVYNKDSPEN